MSSSVSKASRPAPITALVLTGGGARGAYQAGVTLGLSEIFRQQKNPRDLPISIISGLSAGSINGSFLASGFADFHRAAKVLADTWAELKTTDIYRSDPVSLGKIGFQLLSDISFGSLSSTKLSAALLDTRPLGRLLSTKIPFYKIGDQIRSGALHGLSVSAFSYSYQRTAIFYQARTPAVKRMRARRKTREAIIGPEHVMASTAIPVLFPPIEINGHYFADGSIRGTAPFSPPIRLGAEKLLIVGVKHEGATDNGNAVSVKKPSLGQIFGTMLNSLFFDSTDSDMEKLMSINHTLEELKTSRQEITTRYRPIDFLWLRPSRDLGELGELKSSEGLPLSIKYLLGGLGTENQYSELASYLLFDSSFTRQLIELGQQDTLNRKDEILEFLYAR